MLLGNILMRDEEKNSPLFTRCLFDLLNRLVCRSFTILGPKLNPDRYQHLSIYVYSVPSNYIRRYCLVMCKTHRKSSLPSKELVRHRGITQPTTECHPTDTGMKCTPRDPGCVSHVGQRSCNVRYEVFLFSSLRYN